jgi:hypothetical protein
VSAAADLVLRGGAVITEAHAKAAQSLREASEASVEIA